MKLSDIFSLNLNSKGGAKLFKKIANKYNLDYKETRKSVKENTNKYGYYDISLYIRDISSDDGTFKNLFKDLLLVVNNIEITGVFLLHYTAGLCAFSKTNIILPMFISNIDTKIDRNNAKVYIKVDENDMKISFTDIGKDILKVDYKGSMINRFIQKGIPKEEIETIFIPITKEEYEQYAIEVCETIGL